MKMSEIERIRERMHSLRGSVSAQIRDYPGPVAGCDQQFNHLLELRDRIGRELRRIDDGEVKAEQMAELTAFLDAAE